MDNISKLQTGMMCAGTFTGLLMGAAHSFKALTIPQSTALYELLKTSACYPPLGFAASQLINTAFGKFFGEYINDLQIDISVINAIVIMLCCAGSIQCIDNCAHAVRPYGTPTVEVSRGHLFNVVAQGITFGVLGFGASFALAEKMNPN